MRFKTRVEFVNYTLNFGSEKVLLDAFREIVEPSFASQKYIRRTSTASWFFMDVTLIALDSSQDVPVLGLAGRFVKKTKLKRTQVLTSDNQLKEDQRELDSAPSSIFLLILNNHRLLFCKEMPDAPDINNFLKTSEHCLRKAHADHINREVEKLDLSTLIERQEVRKLFEYDIPYPSLRITPLLDGEELTGFIDRFSIINRLTVKLLKTNKDEIDNDDFWESIEKKKEEINGDSVKIEISSTTHSLNKEVVRGEAISAGAYANSDISIIGYDMQGGDLSGDNNDFSLKSEIENLSKNIEIAAKQMFSKLTNMIHDNIISIPPAPPSVSDVFKSLFNVDE
jgi:hypothetical protein